MKSSFRERLLMTRMPLQAMPPDQGPKKTITGIRLLIYSGNFQALRRGSQEKNIVKSICYVIIGIYGKVGTIRVGGRRGAIIMG
jgi:hypothetical protein